MARTRRIKDYYVPAHKGSTAELWYALLEAALDQPAPSPALTAALAGLRKPDLKGCEHGTRPAGNCWLCHKKIEQGLNDLTRGHRPATSLQATD